MSAILQDAGRYLAQREHFHRELVQKLAKKGYEREEIAEAVRQLVDHDYLSETRAFFAYVRSRMAKGMGPEKVRAELSALTSPALIEQYFPRSDHFWCKVLARHWRKRFNEPSGWPIDEKMMRHCVNRGFPYRLIRMMVVDYAQWGEPDEFHEP